MFYKDTLIYPEFVNDFPFLQNPVLEGYIQLTYRTTDNKVLQIGPVVKCPLPQPYLNIINRWVAPCDSNGNSLKAELYYRALIDADRLIKCLGEIDGWQLGIPRMEQMDFGQISQNEHKFPFWQMEKVNGIMLQQWLEKAKENEEVLDESRQLCQRIYRLLVLFLADFHQANSFDKVPEYFQGVGITDASLREYYKNRLIDTKLCFQDIARSGHCQSITADILDDICVFIDYLLESLPCIIDDGEKLHRIHGDFKGDNILIDEEIRKIWVLDFEQGLCGGDWFTDLQKLSLVTDDPEKFGALLQSKERHNLLRLYNDRLNNLPQWFDDFLTNSKESVKKRIRLIKFDLYASVAILRYLMGWLFQESIRAGKIMRGFPFVLGLLNDLIREELS